MLYCRDTQTKVLLLFVIIVTIIIIILHINVKLHACTQTHTFDKRIVYIYLKTKAEP